MKPDVDTIFGPDCGCKEDLSASAEKTFTIKQGLLLKPNVLLKKLYF